MNDKQLRCNDSSNSDNQVDFSKLTIAFVEDKLEDTLMRLWRLRKVGIKTAHHIAKKRCIDSLERHVKYLINYRKFKEKRIDAFLYNLLQKTLLLEGLNGGDRGLMRYET